MFRHGFLILFFLFFSKVVCAVEICTPWSIDTPCSGENEQLTDHYDGWVQDSPSVRHRNCNAYNKVDGSFAFSLGAQTCTTTSCPAGALPDGDGQCLCTSPQVMNAAGTACVTPDTAPCNSPNTLVNGVCTAPPTCTAPQVLINGVCAVPPTCTPPQTLQNGVCADPDPCASKSGTSSIASNQQTGGVGAACSGGCAVQIHDCINTHYDAKGSPVAGFFSCAATYSGSACDANMTDLGSGGSNGNGTSAPATGGSGVSGSGSSGASGPATNPGDTGAGGSGSNLCADGTAKNAAGACTGVGTGVGAGAGGSGDGNGNGSGSCDPATGVCTGNTAEGGNDCSAPPVCTGDAVQCAMLIDSWRQICLTAPVDRDVVNGALVSGGADPAAKLRSEEINIQDKLADSGAFNIQGFSVSCPAPIQVSLHTGAVPLSFQPLCDLSSMLRPLVLLIFGYISFRVFSGAI